MKVTKNMYRENEGYIKKRPKNDRTKRKRMIGKKNSIRGTLEARGSARGSLIADRVVLITSISLCNHFTM